MMNDSMTKPLVSVIMPAYNAGKYIESAIRSVQEQTVQEWELLVLDDGSCDDTCTVVQKLAAEDHRIVLSRNGRNMGVARTRNRGLELCTGAYVAFLDSDDLWHADKLEKQLALMERTGADFSYCSYAIVDAQGNQAKSDYIVPEQVDYEKLLRENVICCSTVMLRRETAQSYRFNAAFFHEDYVLWLQMLKNGCRALGCTEILGTWRYIRDSRSFDKFKSAKNRWRIYRDYLKLPFFKRIAVFVSYMAAGLRKYAG